MLGLSHFQDALNPTFIWGIDIEITPQYLLPCPLLWGTVDSHKQHSEYRQQYFKSE